jgi:type II secretory pathway pseudopilin PulG
MRLTVAIALLGALCWAQQPPAQSQKDFQIEALQAQIATLKAQLAEAQQSASLQQQVCEVLAPRIAARQQAQQTEKAAQDKLTAAMVPPSGTNGAGAGDVIPAAEIKK